MTGRRNLLIDRSILQSRPKLAKIMVNVQCPLCNFFYCLGSVEGEDVGVAMKGEVIPFRVDYRVWSGGRARGITQKRTLTKGYIHPSLYGAWRSFIEKIETARKAVEVVVFGPRVLRIDYSPGGLTKVFHPGRLVIQ